MAPSSSARPRSAWPAASRCGAQPTAAASLAAAKSKSKTTAILLAIFFGYWTWLYTYREDSGKFWINIAVNSVCFVLTILTLGIFALIWLPIILGMYVWAIVDTVGKSDDWYFNY